MRLVRLIAVLLIMICSIFSVGAVDSVSVHLVSSQLWQSVDLLSRASGILGPSSVSPVPEGEIRRVFDEIDRNGLPDYYQQIYDRVYRELYGDERYLLGDEIVRFDASLAAAVEAYIHNNRATEDDFIIHYRDRKPLLSVDFRADFSNWATLFMTYDFENSMYSDSEGRFRGYSNLDFIAWNYSGTWYLMGNKIGDASDIGRLPILQEFMPQRVGGSFGNDYFNFLIGRHRQSFGRGFTGNLLIGDNFSMQELLRFRFASSMFSYTLSYTHFDQQIGPYTMDKFSLNGMHSVRMIHKFEFQPWSKFRASIDVGAIFNMDSVIDWRMFVPFQIIHSFNNKNDNSRIKDPHDEANNILAFEFEYIPVRNLSFTAQVVVDQFRLPGEEADVPTAFGVLFNTLWTKPLDNFHLDLYFETVYTSPYLYLNEKYNNSSSGWTPNYGYDFVVGYWIAKDSEIGYSGYVHGPDSIVFNTGFKLTSPISWAAGFDILYRVQGQKGINYYGNRNTTSDFSGNYSAVSPTGTAEHLLQLKAFGDYYILENLKTSLTLALSMFFNYHHVHGAFNNSMQAVISLSYWI